MFRLIFQEGGRRMAAWDGAGDAVHTARSGSVVPCVVEQSCGLTKLKPSVLRGSPLGVEGDWARGKGHCLLSP